MKRRCATLRPKQAASSSCRRSSSSIWVLGVISHFMSNRVTIFELAAKLAKRESSSRETMQACLDQIQRIDGEIKAFLSYDAADALAQADAADQELAAGTKFSQKPLLGIPIALKDV